MTIEEHLKILWQGVEVWNEWRENSREIRPDLSGADLSGADLSGAYLRGVNLREANLREANLREANFRGANLREANLREANLREANLREANLNRANLSGADLSWANLSGADLSWANLREANLREANLSGADLSGADLSWASLSEANLRGADLRGADLSGADLREANLRGADLRGADLREANLSGANLSETNLNEAKLDETNLRGANLIRTNLERTFLRGAWLNEAKLIGTNLKEANLSGAKLVKAKLRGANFQKADLSQVNACKADFSSVELSEVKLREAMLREAIFKDAKLRKADLSNAKLYKANLAWAKLREANFSGTNLTEANLSGAFLSEANLTDTDLTGANLTEVDLSAANLIRTQALNTCFEGVIFTGACIEHWNINSNTNFKNVICDYIYLRTDQQERRPASGNFEPGDFTRLFQKALETVDLIFRDGIDWQSFATAFQGLQNEQRLKIEGENNQFNIRAIETRDDGSFVIRINVPAQVDKAEIEDFFKQKYERALEAREEFFREKLQAKDEQIMIYRQQSATFEKIAESLASRPIQIQNINQPQGSDMSNIYQNHSGSGDNVGRDKNITYNSQNLTEAAAEIQQLLEQLSNTYPTTTTAEKLAVVTEAAEQIEKNPTLKARVINALQSGGKEALKEAIDHPLVNILMATIEGWQEAE